MTTSCGDGIWKLPCVTLDLAGRTRTVQHRNRGDRQHDRCWLQIREAQDVDYPFKGKEATKDQPLIFLRAVSPLIPETQISTFHPTSDLQSELSLQTSCSSIPYALDFFHYQTFLSRTKSQSAADHSKPRFFPKTWKCLETKFSEQSLTLMSTPTSRRSRQRKWQNSSEVMRGSFQRSKNTTE